MFNFVKASEHKQLKGDVERLVKEKQDLKESLEELKLKKRLEQEEIVHLQRLNEERKNQEVENEKVKLEKKYQEDISKFKEEQRVILVDSLSKFHEKMENRFDSELNNLKEVYTALMTKLPNVNFEIQKRIK